MTICPLALRVTASATLGLALPAGLLAQALPPPPVPPQNPITEAKRVLGKALFWDEQLSTDNTVACGTCHMPRAGGSDKRVPAAPDHPGPDGLFGTDDDTFGSAGVLRQDVGGAYMADAHFGHGPQVTPRFSPSVFTAAWSQELFWDGRASGTFVDPDTGAVLIPAGGALETQALAPLLSDVEMGHEGRTLDDVVARLEGVRPLALAHDLNPDLLDALDGDAGYGDLFEEAFGDPDITAARVALALATYQRTLVPDRSKFDLVMSGEDFFTGDEQDGFLAFQGAGTRCAECHPPPLFSDDAFHNLGLRPVDEDPGRQEVTGDPAHRGQFRTPSLRNAAVRRRLFHTGAPDVPDLDAALDLYDDDGGPFADNKDPLLANLVVPASVHHEILAFLETLTDPRVVAEQPPFDRPRLFSEAAATRLEVLGDGTAGSGGHVPRMIAVSPPLAGGAGFKVGVGEALGGSTAFFVVSLVPAPAGTVVAGMTLQVDPATAVVLPVALAGAGAGDGHATLPIPLAADVPTGVPVFAQWFVADAGAPNGVLAASAGVRVEPF